MARRRSRPRRDRAAKPPPRGSDWAPLSLAVLTEGGHDLLREVADQAELVVEMDTNPERRPPGLDRALELLRHWGGAPTMAMRGAPS